MREEEKREKKTKETKKRERQRVMTKDFEIWRRRKGRCSSLPRSEKRGEDEGRGEGGRG